MLISYIQTSRYSLHEYGRTVDRDSKYRSEILHRLSGSIDIYETGQILVVLLAVSSYATHGRINEARSKRSVPAAAGL